MFTLSKKKESYYILCRSKILPLILGFGLIFIFFLIFFILVLKTNRIDFYSFFFKGIKEHFFLTILSGFHVSFLASGILVIIVSFFSISPEVKCYDDRFEIGFLVQKQKTIKYNSISNVSVKIFYHNYEDFFKKYPKKECRVYLNNPIYVFYLCYPVKGYFDEVEIFLKKEKNDIFRRCIISKKEIMKILIKLKIRNNINIPYLPDQDKHFVFDKAKK